MISDALARRFWPDERGPSEARTSALGKRLITPRAPYPLTVIGVARDATDAAIWREKELSVYVPAESTRTSLDVELLVHTQGDRDLVAAELRQAARAFDRNIQIEARPMDDVLRFWKVPAQVAAIAGAVLGGLALALSAIGIYGMIAYTVKQRTREIGIRLALGARSQDVLALVIGSGVRLIVIGIVAGLAGALLMTRFLKVLLAVVDPLDPVAFAAATAFLTIIALAASYLPARRAASVDPMVALRTD